jgi:hypothetical protein
MSSRRYSAAEPHRACAGGTPHGGRARGGWSGRPCGRTAIEPRRAAGTAGGPGPAGDPGRAGHGPRPRTAADPLRTDGRLALHLLPRRRRGDGRRPRRDAHLRHHGPTLRGRALVELRAVRLTRTAPGLRHQRFRRDPARALGVGHQAARSQRRDRRQGPRLRHAGAAGCGRVGRTRLPGGDTQLRGKMPTLDVWYAHGDAEQIEAILAPRLKARGRKRLGRGFAKARTRDHLGSLDRFTTVVDGMRG